MRIIRQCSKPECSNHAVATLTYVYSEAMLVLGPLSTNPEPHTYDLCQKHVDSLKAPRGWTVQQLTTEFVAAPPHDDDLDALAQVVRKASKKPATPPQRPSSPIGPQFGGSPQPSTAPSLPQDLDATKVRRVGHLRVLDGEGDTP